MKNRKVFKFILSGCIFLALASSAKVVSADPDALVESGKFELFFNQDLLAANDDFNQALIEDGTHARANFWYGLTRVCVVIQSAEMVTLLTDFGCTKNDDSPLDQAALNPFNPDIKFPSAFPTDSPNLEEVQDFLKTTFLAAIDAALTDNFSILDESTFADSADLGFGPLEVDGGEVLAGKTLFNLFSCLLHVFCVYDTDAVDIDALLVQIEAGTFSINSFLANYTDFLTPLGDAAAQLTAAESVLSAALNGAFDTLNFIQAETDDQGDDLITIDDSDPQTAEIISTAQNLFSSLIDSLSGPAPITMPSYMYGGELDMQVTLDLSEFFDDTDVINLRSLLPSFTADNEIVRSSFPDPTIGNMFPDMTQADWNHFFVGPELYEPLVIWSPDGVPSVELSWGQEDDPGFSYYRIYRSTTPDESSSWVQIGSDISNLATTTLTDDAVDESVSTVYYYRLHTYYNAGTEETYSDIVKAVLVIYVDINSVSPDEDGSKGNPFKDLGDAIDDNATNGTKICVAQGTYPEADRSLGMWNKDGLILQGGYESNNWTRDIQAFETIIDSTGLAGWNVVGFSDVEGGTVDGFTVTGGDMLGDGAGVLAYQSPSVTIKNCKIINNKRGIGILNNSTSCLVENCYIAQNTGRGIEMNDSSAVVKNCSITENGSAIGAWHDSALTVSDTSVFGNSSPGGNEWIHTVGIYDSTFTATGLNITQNQGRGIFIGRDASFDIRDSRISDNGGRGFESENGYGIFSNNLVVNNGKTGVFCRGLDVEGEVIIENNTIVGNGENGGIACSLNLPWLEVDDQSGAGFSFTGIWSQYWDGSANWGAYRLHE